MNSTAKLTSSCVHPVGATVSASRPRRERRPVGRDLLTSLPGGQIGFLIVVNVLTFLLAFFLDFSSWRSSIVPLLAPLRTSWAST